MESLILSLTLTTENYISRSASEKNTWHTGEENADITDKEGGLHE